MTSTYDYSDWNREKLIHIYKHLQAKKRTYEENRDYLFLKYILYGHHTSFSPFKLDHLSFKKAFSKENSLIKNDYLPYLEHIFSFYLNNDEELVRVPLTKIDTNPESILTSVHDFYYNLDKELFELFNSLYKKRKGTLVFQENRSFSRLLETSNIWISSIEKDNTVGDYVDTVHEYGHGIVDLASSRQGFNPVNNILIELFPLTFQTIYLLTQDELSDLRDDYLNNYKVVMLEYAEEIKAKYNIAIEFGDITSPFDLSCGIKTIWHQDLSVRDIKEAYKTSIGEYIIYVIGYILSQNLINLYFKDQEEFAYTLKNILKSNEHPLKIIKEIEKRTK